MVKIRPSIGTDDHHICGTFAQPEDYKAAIQPANGAEIETIAVEEYPDMAQAHSPDEPSLAKVKVHYKDGSIHLLDVPVMVNANVIPARKTVRNRKARRKIT